MLEASNSLGRDLDDGQQEFLQQRLVSKSGRCNINMANVNARRLMYLTDIFTTVIDMRWRYNLVFYTIAFMSTWTIFGLFWWFVVFLRRNNEPTTSDVTEQCVDNVRDFITAFLFSFETQQTIGYGDRVIRTTCPYAIILFLAQALVGVLTACIVTGLIFVKLSRPKSRAQTIVFSKRAVICIRNGGYCLVFRIGDIRRSHFVKTNIRAILVKNTTIAAAADESIPLCQCPLELETESTKTNNFVFLLWPVTAIHRITERSPLWNMSKDEKVKATMEIIVILEGIVETSGKYLQLRTSYLQTEIMWGAELTPLTTYKTANGKTKIDFREFHSTFPVRMPTGSARMYRKTTFKRRYRTSSDREAELTFEPLTVAPLNVAQDYIRRRRRFATAWKKWRRARPLAKLCCHFRRQVYD